MKVGNGKNWHTSEVNEFWSKTASQNNVFHVYENENRFIDLLTGFVGTGVNSNECSIVIATRKHLDRLHQQLGSHGVHVHRLIEDGRYHPIDADSLLSQFMINDLPDENLFFECINNLVRTAQRGNRKIRAYREMVVVLQESGNTQARAILETFWSKFSQIEQVLIFCAYPKNSVDAEECKSLREFGFSNPKLVRATKSQTQLLFTNCSGT